MNLLIKKGAKEWDDGYWHMGLKYACKGGDIDIVNLMIEKGANDWDQGLHNACVEGHLDIMFLMIIYGATLSFDNKHYQTYLNIKERIESYKIIEPLLPIGLPLEIINYF